MLRRMLGRQIRVVQEGGRPEGAGHGQDVIAVKAGNYFG
jgi:hypothetical protein